MWNLQCGSMNLLSLTDSWQMEALGEIAKQWRSKHSDILVWGLLQVCCFSSTAILVNIDTPGAPSSFSETVVCLSCVTVFLPKVWTPCDRRGEIGTAFQLDHHVWHQKCCHYKVGHFIFQHFKQKSMWFSMFLAIKYDFHTQGLCKLLPHLWGWKSPETLVAGSSLLQSLKWRVHSIIREKS